MSRHVLIDRPELQVVVGFDPPLRYFFGQAFNPDRPNATGSPIDGWPTRYGLGIQPPVESEGRAKVVLASLALWLTKYVSDADAIVAVRDTLLAEWKGEPARPEPWISQLLRGPHG